MSDYKIHRNERFKHERQFWWVLNLTFSLPGWVTPGAMGAPHNTLAAVSLLLGPTPLALREPDRQIPLHAVKPSTREQRGQVLRATLRAHLHPAGEQTSRTNTSSTVKSPHQAVTGYCGSAATEKPVPLTEISSPRSVEGRMYCSSNCVEWILAAVWLKTGYNMLLLTSAIISIWQAYWVPVLGATQLRVLFKIFEEVICRRGCEKSGVFKNAEGRSYT